MSGQANIVQAILHITYACTHHCPMCYANAGSHFEHPTINKLHDIVDRLSDLGINDITLVGGDPALYPDIVLLASYIKQKNIHLSVLSNTLDFLPSNSMVLDYIDVYEGTIHHSIPGQHDKFCGCEGAFEKLVKNLKFFSSHNKSTGLAINLIPFNYKVIYDIVETVISRDITLDYIIFQRIIQFGRATGSYQYELSCEMLRKIMHQIEKIEQDFDLNIVFEDPFPLCSVEEKYQKYMHPCEWGLTKVSVDFDGNLSRCGADVFHSFGSVFDKDIVEKWSGDSSLNEYRSKSYLPYKCLSCQYLYKCGGGCPISREPGKGFSLDYLAK